MKLNEWWFGLWAAERWLAAVGENSLCDVVDYIVLFNDLFQQGESRLEHMNQPKMEIVSSYYEWHDFGECIIV